MFRIGCHISSADGYLAMAKRAEALGANTFAFFTRNPRGGSAKAIEETDIAAFHAECARAGIDRLVAHAPYTLNPCAAKPNVAEFARMAFSDDLQRMEHTPGQLYNFHPGSHVGQGIDAGIEKIAALLNEVLFPGMTTTVLLETMAVKGSEVGGRFEELRAIRDGAAFDAVICGCDVQQTFCWQPDMCITDACEAEFYPLLDAEIRILAAAPGERFSIIEICTDRLFLGDAFSQCAAGYCSPREYRRLFRAG